MTSQSFGVGAWLPVNQPQPGDMIRVKSVAPLVTEFAPYTSGSTVPGPPGPQGPEGLAIVGPPGPPGPLSFPDAPNDGVQYARQNGAWTPVVLSLSKEAIKQYVDEKTAGLAKALDELKAEVQLRR